MGTEHLVPADVRDLYEVHEWRNAAGVLSTACVSEWAELLDGLRQFRLMRSEVLTPGGNRSFIADRFERPFKALGWIEKQFQTAITVDGAEMPSPTHSIDCFKGRVALELEWNNKDPFYDRDLNNFRLLYDLRVIDAGVIVTRTDHLQEIFKQLGRGASYGASTTHMSKLLPRIQGGGGGGCPKRPEQSIRQARANPDSAGYRSPPADWRDGVIKLAEARAKALHRLADQLRRDS